MPGVLPLALSSEWNVLPYILMWLTPSSPFILSSITFSDHPALHPPRPVPWHSLSSLHFLFFPSHLPLSNTVYVYLFISFIVYLEYKLHEGKNFFLFSFFFTRESWLYQIVLSTLEMPKKYFLNEWMNIKTTTGQCCVNLFGHICALDTENLTIFCQLIALFLSLKLKFWWNNWAGRLLEKADDCG